MDRTWWRMGWLLVAMTLAVGVLGGFQDERWTVEDVRPGEGERCIVCGEHIVGENVVHLRYRGREVTVGEPLLGEWEADPDRYFRPMESRTALFDERSMEGGELSFGWLFFGIYVLIGTLVGGVTAYLAIARGLRPLPWFFAGVAFNVVALIAVMTRATDPTSSLEGVPPGLSKVPVTRSPDRCDCGATNHPCADRCSRCGVALDPRAQAETARVGGGA